MSGATATYVSKDQNWADETTTYWFSIEGDHEGAGVEFDDYEGELFGIVEHSVCDTQVVDGDNCPLTEGDRITIAVRPVAAVTDEMRSQ